MVSTLLKGVVTSFFKLVGTHPSTRKGGVSSLLRDLGGFRSFFEKVELKLSWHLNYPKWDKDLMAIDIGSKFYSQTSLALALTNFGERNKATLEGNFELKENPEQDNAPLPPFSSPPPKK